MYLLVSGCGTLQEAMEKAGVCVGQKARVVSIKAFGGSNGTWTIIPQFELKKPRLQVMEDTGCNRGTEGGMVNES